MTDQNSEELAKRLDELEKKYNELKAKLIQESELQKRENELKIKEVELNEREINLAKKELELAKKEKDSGKTTTTHSERHPVLPVEKVLKKLLMMDYVKEKNYLLLVKYGLLIEMIQKKLLKKLYKNYS